MSNSRFHSLRVYARADNNGRMAMQQSLPKPLQSGFEELLATSWEEMTRSCHKLRELGKVNGYSWYLSCDGRRGLRLTIMHSDLNKTMTVCEALALERTMCTQAGSHIAQLSIKPDFGLDETADEIVRGNLSNQRHWSTGLC